MKRIYIYLFLVFSFQSQAYDLNHIYKTIKAIESNNDASAIGDNGKAYGIAQIHKVCVEDVNRIFGTYYTHEDMFNEECAEEVFMLYLGHGIERYEKRYNTKPKVQDIVRMWNGGIYSGYKRPTTLKYYNRFINRQKSKTMAKEYTVIEIDERDMKKLISDKYNLEINSVKLTFPHWKGDQREPAHTSIVAKGRKIKTE